MDMFVRKLTMQKKKFVFKGDSTSFEIFHYNPAITNTKTHINFKGWQLL